MFFLTIFKIFPKFDFIELLKGQKMSQNLDRYLDVPTLEYEFAYRKKIGVEYVYTFIKSRDNIEHISLVDNIIILGKKGWSIRAIRDEISIKYKPITTDQVFVIYEHYFENKLSQTPHLLQGIHGEYDRKKKTGTFTKLYHEMLQASKGYLNIVNRAKNLLHDIFKLKPLDASAAQNTNQMLIFNFETDITAYQFYHINTNKHNIPYISLDDKYNISPDIGHIFIERHLGTKMPDTGIHIIISFSKKTKLSGNLKLIVDYEQKTITIGSGPKVNLNEVLAILKDTLTGIHHIKTATSKDFIGNFKIYSVDYNPLILSFMVMNSSPINQILYIDEKDQAASVRGESGVYHVNSLGYWFDVPRYREFKKNRSIIRFTVKTGKEIKTISEKGKVSYVQINYNHAISERSIDILKNYTQRLFNYYMNKKENIKKLYTSFGFSVTLKKSVVDSADIEKRIGTLTNIFEQIYKYRPTDYSSKCELKRQPKLISDQEYKDFIAEGKEHRVQTLTAEENNKTYHLYCDSERYPDIHIPEGGLPCCFSAGKVPQKLRSKTSTYGYKSETHPILTFWLEYLLLSVQRKGTSKGVFYRIGAADYGTNSFYASILYALNHKTKASQLKTDINNLKADILKELIKRQFSFQENFGLDEKDLKTVLIKDGNFGLRGVDLDNYVQTNKLTGVKLSQFININEHYKKTATSIFYSIIEDLLKINIYVFETKQEQFNFESYHKKQFYTKPDRDYDRSIIILKYFVNKSPRYEPIINIITETIPTQKKGRSIKIETITAYFGANTTQKLKKAWFYQFKTDLITYDGLQKKPLTYPTIYNKLSNVEPLTKTQGNRKTEKLFQLTDVYNKVRGIVLLVNIENKATSTRKIIKESFYLKLYTLPITYNPNNGPIKDFDDYLEEEDKYPDPMYYQVLNYFGEYPLSITFKADGKDKDYVNGLWYYYKGISAGVYCPIEPIEENVLRSIIPHKYLTETNPPPYTAEELSSNVEYHLDLKIQSHNILTLISYLFSVSGLSIEAFSSYLVVDVTLGADIEFSNKIYFEAIVKLEKMAGKQLVITRKGVNILQKELLALDKLLTSYETDDLGDEYEVKTLINGTKIVCYSHKMRQGILYYLQNYTRNLEINEKNLRYKSFSGNIHISFETKKTLIGWLDNKEKYKMYTNLKNIYDIESNQPIIYRTDSKYFIIQKTMDYDFYRAVNIALNWYKKKINLGSNVSQYDSGQLPNTEILSLDIRGNIDFGSIAKSKALLVLWHSPNKFSAVLPLN